MAELLIEQWRLAVLRVRLDLTERIPAVTTELVGYTGRTPRSLWTRRHPLAAYGIDTDTPDMLGSLRVPGELRELLGRSLEEDLRGESSLWLRLEPPYGYLGAVPWEEAALSVSRVPLLRVPDRLPAAAEPGHLWSAVIAVSAPAGSTWAAPYVVELVGQLDSQIRGKRDVHIFADVETVTGLQGAALPPWAHVHEPRNAVPASQERSRRRQSQGRYGTPAPAGRVWADWIAAGLAGRAVRALHVVLDAAWDHGRPMLAVSPDPNARVDLDECHFVTADDVGVLSDAIGAATLSFGSPPGNPADVATRMLADGIGRQRQGPTLYSSIERDPGGVALARAYAFLAKPDARTVPRDASLFAHLQPGHVRDALAEDWPEPEPPGFETPEESDLSDYYASTETVPTWVASSERFIGSELAGLTQDASTPQPGTDYKEAYNRGAAEALSQLQALVARHVRSQ